MQSIFAYNYDVFFPISDNGVTEFLEDRWNLINYIVIVELYCFCGVGYILSFMSIDEGFQEVGINRFLGEPLPSATQVFGDKTLGIWGFGLTLLIPLIAGPRYALEVQEISAGKFWFNGMAQGNTSYGFSGYYYLYLNFILLCFVVLVAVMHIGLFRWSQILSSSLRKVYEGTNVHENTAWSDDHKINQAFAPFSETVIWSKGFIICLVANIYTWELSKVTTYGGSELGLIDWSVFLLALIGMWLVSFPRYIIEYRIFHIKKKLGIQEYKDIRMPWVLGWSAFIDGILLIFLLKILFGNVADKFGAMILN